MKKIVSSLLACALIAGSSLTAFAADINAYNGDGDLKISNNGAGLSFEGMRPDTTYYIPMDQIIGDTASVANIVNSNGDTIATITDVNAIDDNDYFNVSFSKDGDGKSLIKSVEVVNDKIFTSGQAAIDITSRTSWLKVVTNQTFSADEKKAGIEVTVKPKKSAAAATTQFGSSDFYNNILTRVDPAGGTAYPAITTSDKSVFKLTFWIQNAQQNGDSYDAETGDSFVFNPTSNSQNNIIYGDDRAGIYFDANDDAEKFYAKLSTKSISDIYTTYGDPVDADLWFYDFVGQSTVPSTARATITLGIPWDEDKDYVPDPESCYIYTLNSDGTLTDVTASFTYSEDNDDTTGIAGWSTKTRTLGTYIVSDTELELDSYDDEQEDTDDEIIDDTTSGGTSSEAKPIPPTGSSDMVNVAVVGAVVSLAAAGAVAFRKKAK